MTALTVMSDVKRDTSLFNNTSFINSASFASTYRGAN